VDHVPDTVSALPELLSGGQLQKDKRHPLKHHHDQEGEDESA
jgi:hypothetical protein